MKYYEKLKTYSSIKENKNKGTTMPQPLHRLPLRKTAEGEQIETRPLYIEEWLDSLPYIDFNRTAGLLAEATGASNRQSMKPSVRLELVALYSRPYQYYLDSQIRTGAQHTLQSMEAMRAQIAVLKRIAVNLAYAAKLAAEDSLKKKTLWGKSKPPLQALLLSLNYLSHALVFSFQEYAVTPKNVWHELHCIYDFAAGLGRENTGLVLPVGDSRHNQMTITQAYKRILFTALADPHHLPFGAVWEIFEQLFTWTDYVTITGFGEVPEAAGRFVVDLDSDAAPVPWNKFTPPASTDRLRLLDATALNRHMEKLPADSGGEMVLSPYYARLILDHITRAWSLPPQRSAQRRPAGGHVKLAYGMNAAYFFINGNTEFRPSRDESREIIAGETPPEDEMDDITPVTNHSVDTWDLVNQTGSGYSLLMRDTPRVTVRIGDLVALRLQPAQEEGENTWSTGVIRWLTVRRNQSYRIGVEVLAGTAAAAAVRAVTGSEPDRRFRRALLINGEGGETTMLTGKGLYIAGRELEVETEGRRQRRRAGELLDSTLSFELFLLRPA